jgi:hypothetical protein
MKRAFTLKEGFVNPRSLRATIMLSSRIVTTLSDCALINCSWANVETALTLDLRLCRQFRGAETAVAFHCRDCPKQNDERNSNNHSFKYAKCDEHRQWQETTTLSFQNSRISNISS